MRLMRPALSWRLLQHVEQNQASAGSLRCVRGGRSLVVSGVRAECHQRCREGRNRCSDARRMVEAASEALIEKVRSHGHRRERRLSDDRSASRELQAHVHAAGLQRRHPRTRAAVELRRHHQRRPQGRHAAGIGHGLRPVAAGRRAEQRQAAGADPRRARRGADRPHHPGPRPAGARRDLRPARRRRLARHAADLLLRPRHRLGPDRGHGRRPDDQRPDGRRRRQRLPQRGDDPGSRLHDLGRQRRDDDRRRQPQPGPQGRRQPLHRRLQVSPRARRRGRATT